MDGHHMESEGSIAMSGTISTHAIVADYLKYRLQKANFPSPSAATATPSQSPRSARVQKTLQALTEEFEERYDEVFDEMTNQLHITPENAQSTFISVASELFHDGVKWGRVVAMFSFAGRFAIKCAQGGMVDMVDSVHDWVVNYIDGHLMSWMLKNDGWAGLMDFYHGNREWDDIIHRLEQDLNSAKSQLGQRTDDGARRLRTALLQVHYVGATLHLTSTE